MFFVKAEEPLLLNSYQVKDVTTGKIPGGKYIIYGLLYSKKELFLFQGIDSFNYMWVSDEMIVWSSKEELKALHGCYVAVKGTVGYVEENDSYFMNEIESIERVGMFDLLADGDKEPICIVPALVEIMKRWQDGWFNELPGQVLSFDF